MNGIKIVHVVDEQSYSNAKAYSSGHCSNSKLLDKNLDFEKIIKVNTKTSPTKFLEKIRKEDPDIVLFGIINNCVLNSIQNIQREYRTALRVSINLIEISLSNIISINYRKIIESLGNFDVLIPSNELQKANLEAIGHQYISEPVYPMVDINYFKQFRSINNKENIVSSVGRHSPIKNMFFNIHVMENVMQRHPGSIMHIYNSGPYSKYIKNYKNESPFNNRIGMFGNKPINKIYEVTKVGLSMSLNENHSVAVIESVASGVPVVCSDIFGHKPGIKVKYDDINGAADEIYKLLIDDGYYKEKQLEGYKGLGKYTPETIVPKYEVVFENMMEWER